MAELMNKTGAVAPKKNIMTDEERLVRRINREFPKVKYLSDIKINDSEYEILKKIIDKGIEKLWKSRNERPLPNLKPEFAVGIVNVALRVYDGNLWSNLCNELHYTKLGSNSRRVQELIGIAFLNVLKKHGKDYVGETCHVNNILQHCYVSNSYLDDYFMFLYKFYSLDLDRDISRFDRDAMNGLIDSICSDEIVNRTYMLVRQTADAVRANVKGAKIRIRNHIKLMDRLYFDPDYEVETDHRIYSALAKWIHENDEVKKDRNYIHRKGTHHFSSPYLKYCEENDSLSIVLPSQSISNTETFDVFWLVEGSVSMLLPVELTPSVIGYKAHETSANIPMSCALESFTFKLCNGCDKVFKQTKIPQSDIRFFDKDGYLITSDRVKVGNTTAITMRGNSAVSSAWYDNRIVDGMEISFYDFSFEDFLRLPNGKAIIVGKDVISNGLCGNSCLENVSCRMNEREYPLYTSMPNLVIRMKKEKMPGAAIAINDVHYRFSDVTPTGSEFLIDDLSDDCGYYVNLADVVTGIDGKYTICVDIPGSTVKEWNFMLIKDFNADFGDSPYIFRPRGTVTFPENHCLTALSDGCIREKDCNTFKFEVEQAGRTLDFLMTVGDCDCKIQLPIPAVYTKIGEGDWTSLKPEMMWHNDVPDELDICVPYHKITLSIDTSANDEIDEIDDIDDQNREVTFKRVNGESHIHCDIRRMKSYIHSGSALKTIHAVYDNNEFDLLQILTRSLFISATMVGDFEANTINVAANIAGKGSYCFDLYKEDQLVCEKAPLVNGSATVSFDGIRAQYRTVIFEIEEDSSGFEMAYAKIGEVTQTVTDPHDMSGRVLKLVRICGTSAATTNLCLNYQYYVRDMTPIEGETATYNGTMIVAKRDEAYAAFPVKVRYEDIMSPSKAYIYLCDEYGDSIDFLYDTKHYAIVQEGSKSISHQESYRRYTLLSEDTCCYEVAFTNQCSFVAKGLPSRFEIMIADDIIRRAIRNHVNDQFNRYIVATPWTKGAFLAMRELRLDTLGELSDLTVREFVFLTNATDDVVETVEKVLADSGLCFKEEE